MSSNGLVIKLKKQTINDCSPKLLEDVSVFYRFAKAREFNLVEAEAMLRNHIAWRKEMEIDSILTDYEPPEVLVKYVPTNLLCFDKDGGLVRFNDGGGADLKGLMNVVKKMELSKYFCYIMEGDKERVINNGGNLGKPMYLVAYDFGNYSYSNAVSLKTFRFIYDNLNMFIDNYPETIKFIIVFNAPSYFAWTYAVIKRILPPVVARKVRVYDTDEWKDYLLKVIDADDLPAFLGGNRTDPDGNPLCKTFINRGRPIPKKYYSDKGCKKFCIEPDVKKLTVLPLSKEEVSYEVNEENSYLEWEFGTKNGDIEFSLAFKEQQSEEHEPEQIIPKIKVDTCGESEKGRLKCEKSGLYTIVFDNSFSWLRSKEVYYRIRLQDPKSEDS